MGLVTKKVRQTLHRNWKEFKSAKSYIGLPAALYGLAYHLFGFFGGRYFHLLNQYAYKNYIAPQHYKDPSNWNSIPQNGPIWVLWWQGLEECKNPLVRACLDSIVRHANGREVILIDQNNYSSYASIDEEIVKKFEKNEITITSLSDIIRMALLSQKGGIWLDATVYLTEDIPSDISEYTFYSSQSYRKYPEAHWTTYFIACGPNNPFCRLMYQAFVQLYKDVTYNPEYFMIDVLLMAAYQHYPNVRKNIDVVPVNNPERFLLGDQLNNPRSTLNLPPNEYINKLTYKRKYKTIVDGQETVYGALIRGEL